MDESCGPAHPGSAVLTQYQQEACAPEPQRSSVAHLVFVADAVAHDGVSERGVPVVDCKARKVGILGEPD